MNKVENQKRNLRRKEARPDEIVDSAMSLWASQGFATTKIEDIAKGAGVAKGTVYLYFKSKEAIFETAVKIRLVSTMEQIDELIKDDSMSTTELMQNFYRAVYTELFVNGSATLMKVLIAEGHRFPDLARAYKTIALAKGMNTIASILDRGVKRGELSKKAITIDKRLVMAPVIMFATWGMVIGKSSEAEFFNLIEDHIAMFMKGMS